MKRRQPAKHDLPRYNRLESRPCLSHHYGATNMQAPVAQRIRASHCGCEGQRFESSRAYRTGQVLVICPVLYVCERCSLQVYRISSKQSCPRLLHGSKRSVLIGRTPAAVPRSASSVNAKNENRLRQPKHGFRIPQSPPKPVRAGNRRSPGAHLPLLYAWERCTLQNLPHPHPTLPHHQGHCH